MINEAYKSLHNKLSQSYRQTNALGRNDDIVEMQIDRIYHGKEQHENADNANDL